MALMRHVILYFSILFTYLIPCALGDTCAEVGSTTSINIKRAPAPEYATEQLNYWSTGCGALKPSCIFFPTTTEEVAAIVRVLNQNNETFAVKSGGHNPNKGAASVQDGPLISTKDLNEVTFEASSMTVRVGPGNDWDDVHKALDNTGVTVVGGRIGDVGVGGYIVGGGLSFLSTQYGWAANNIVEFEVVLGNATIVTASETSHPDLYKVLKGGGNNYGIVTAYTIVAHPIGQIWGGNLMFTADKTDEVLEAVRQFTENYPDEKAGIIVTSELTAVGAVNIWILFLFYDGPTPPPGVFDVFTDIGPTTNNCKTRSYYDLLSYNNFAVLRGSIYTITTETLPVPSAANGKEVMGTLYEHWKNTTKDIITVGGIIGSIAFQPIPKMLARKAKELGGDMIDLDEDVHRIIIEFNYSYSSSIDDGRVDGATTEVFQGMRERITNFQREGKLPDAYLPLFMNDAYFKQDYFGRLRTAEYARSVREQYDPQGFFAERTGGWKM